MGGFWCIGFWDFGVLTFDVRSWLFSLAVTHIPLWQRYAVAITVLVILLALFAGMAAYNFASHERTEMLVVSLWVDWLHFFYSSI